jgi:hypothetical protein
MTAKRIFHARVRQMLGILALSASLGIGTVLADTVTIKGDAPQNYTVIKGDTLWDISGKYLEQPWRWPELWEGNPQIANPHLIYPGDVISLYYKDGQPHLGINRASGTGKLSPKIRSSVIDDAIPVIPIEAIQQFLRKLKVLDKATIDGAPYVIRGQEARIIAAHGDRVYVKGLTTDDSNKRFQIYHVDDPINDPATGNLIAHEGIYVGDAKFDKAGDPATLYITTAAREARVGDIIVARDSDRALTNFQPKVPEQQINGQILNIIDGVGIFTTLQAVIINRGAADGLSRGHVLSAFSQGETVPNDVTTDPKDTVRLPNERAGTLMVIEAFENLSYALAMESRLQMRILDEVRTPE